jgi:predicted dehydrogenase/threonine dehydrogenase-like Zn-dependent dehydrogenase
MKQVLITGGAVVVEDVTAPRLEPGTLIVQVRRSCISSGTELASVKSSGLDLWDRIAAHPQRATALLDRIKRNGFAASVRSATQILRSVHATGYSAAGIVVDVGSGVAGFGKGDRVACAGAECAHHAELIRVPAGLAAPIPDSMSFESASTVALGAIAMHGVRRAQPTLGECFGVIGLGVIGQIAAQVLKTCGCRVIGTDIDETRVQVAIELGMDAGVRGGTRDHIERVWRMTGGSGLDGVIVTASGSSDQILAAAFAMCRKKARVVVVGDVSLNVNRADIYKKELDLLISTSYGPGRYDRNYEENGVDYPLPYVRWTEGRNMAEYLRLVSEGRINVARLISAVHDVDDAANAYRTIATSGEQRPLIVLLSYKDEPAREPARPPAPLMARSSTEQNQVSIAVIGTGSFASAVHLPNLQALRSMFRLRAVVGHNGHTAMSAAQQYKAEYASSDYREVLEDSGVDAVLIATRHNVHAQIALEALKAGKHVLVEKPLSLSEEELESLVGFYAARTNGKEAAPLLLTGFNRRFSCYATAIAEAVRKRSGPLLISYRVNAGYLPPEHWVHTAEGGGRNRGEACHMYDFFTYLTGSRVRTISALRVENANALGGAGTDRDTFVGSFGFEDGSVASLTYTALGPAAFPKERIEVFVDGSVFVLDDFRRLSGAGIAVKNLETKTVEKGHKAELQAFARAILGKGEWPIPLWQQVQATQMACTVERLLV